MDRRDFSKTQRLRRNDCKPWPRAIGLRAGDPLAPELTGSVEASFRGLGQDRMGHLGIVGVQTIDQGHVKTRTPEKACDLEKAQGLGPEIVGREIENPGVDEQNRRFHVIGLIRRV